MLPETNNINTCIFCMSLVNKTANTRRHLKADSGFGDALLDNEVNVIFIVRKLLSIPGQQCAELLEKFGNPSSWLVSCSKCSETVNDAREIYKKISVLEETMDRKRKEVRQKIIDSWNESMRGSLKKRRSSVRAQDYSPTALIRIKVLFNELKIGDEEVEDAGVKEEASYYDNLEDDSIQDDFCISGHDGTEMDTKPTELEPHKINDAWTTNGGHKTHSVFKRSTKVLRKRSRKLGCSNSNSKPRKIGSYKCSHCSVVFTLPGRLRDHLKRRHWIHADGSSDRRCPSCHMIFHDLDTFRKHCIDDHSMLSCNLCPRLFLLAKNLHNHQSLTHDRIKKLNKQSVVRIKKTFLKPKVGGGEVYKCPYCNFCSIKQGKTTLHIREIHWELYTQMKNKRCNHSESTSESSDQKTLQCNLCPISGDGSETNQFCSLEDLNQHKVTAHKMFQCKKCFRVFIGMGYLENHQKRYHSTESEASSKLLAETKKAENKLPKICGEKKKPTCKYCQASFETRSQLTQHNFDTHPNELFTCEKCPEKFETVANLYFHKTAVHGESDNPYKCSLCNYSNRRFRQVHVHRMKMHEERTRFVCETCGDSYADERYLKYHKICKHGVKSDINLNCTGCSKVFTSPIYLKRHYNTVHLGQWRYKCPQCDIGFMSQKQVDHHVNSVHEKILPFECTVEGCEKKYASNVTLNGHIRRVHGPKSFKCSYCDYACSDSRQIKTHEEEKHLKSGSYQCDFCGKSYTIHRCLKQHLRMTHKIRLGRGKQAKLTDFVAQTLAEANSTTQHDAVSTSNVINDIKP